MINLLLATVDSCFMYADRHGKKFNILQDFFV